MAMNKTAGVTKKTAKKSVKSTAKKAAPKKAAGAAKKAAPKKAAGPKLSPPQAEMLKKVAGHSDPLGYHAEKKPENKTLETLLKHKLVKKGKKHGTTGHYHYSVTKAGQKHLQTSSSSAPKSS